MTTISTEGVGLGCETRPKIRIGDNIRSLIADQLGVDIRRVTDQSHFVRDFGVSWLSRLELVMLVEDRTDLELHDDDIEQINCVGDLIGLFEGAGSGQTRGQ